MRILVVESQPGQSALIRERLESGGQTIVTCADEGTGGPCRSIERPLECPLEQHVDLAIVVRAQDAPDTLLETGAVCAERRRVPVTRVDPDAERDDVEAAVRHGVASGQDRIQASYASVVRSALGDDRVQVEAVCETNRVQIRLAVPATCVDPPLWALVDRARAAVRGFDPFVSTIDVAVESGL